MLIFDLDDTIYDTKSIDPKVVRPAISIIEDYYRSHFNERDLEKLILDLWSIPVDEVFKKYATPKAVIKAFYTEINSIDFRFDIKPFNDYPVMRNFNCNKVLVTTGISKLQWAKVKALGIQSDFHEIYIDDPQQDNRLFKYGIFKQILADSNLQADEIWVVGDNPDSELKAGKALGMRTVQRMRPGRKKWKLADFVITSINELKVIIE